jgi:hypothetical protein
MHCNSRKSPFFYIVNWNSTGVTSLVISSDEFVLPFNKIYIFIFVFVFVTYFVNFKQFYMYVV